MAGTPDPPCHDELETTSGVAGKNLATPSQTCRCRDAVVF
jgi:hypothetical protein